MRNKFFSSALLFDDTKNILFSVGASAIVIFLFTFSFFWQPNNYIITNQYTHSEHFLVTVDNSSIIFFVLFMSSIALLVFYSNKENKYSYLMTQPISRDSIVITKTIGVMLSYAIPLIFYILVSAILIALNTSATLTIKLEAFKYVLSNVFIAFYITTFIITLLQLMQMFFSNNIAALAMPALIVTCLSVEIPIMTITLSPKIEFVRTFLKFSYDKIFGDYRTPGIVPLFLDYCSNHAIVAGIITLIFAAAILAVTILLNRKIKYENLSGIFTFKIIKNIFKGIISLLFVILIESIICIIIALLFQKITGNSIDMFVSDTILNNNLLKNICEYLVLIVNITWIPLTMLVYKLITKIENRRMVA